MKKTVLLMLLLLTLTAFSKAQGLTRCFNEKDLRVIISDRIENPLLKAEITQLDSLVDDLKKKNAELESKVESVEREASVCDATVEIQSGQLDEAERKISEQKSTIEKQEITIGRVKRQRWYLLGVGFVVGVSVYFVF